MRALFTGSFDPVTNGHLDIISRIAPMVETLVVAVAMNVRKRPIFSDAERVELLQAACQPWPNVEIRSFTGLVAEAARELGAQVIVRGIRCMSEFDGEMQMAQANRALTGVETLLLPASPQWAFLSSSMIKEIAGFSGDISPYVPAGVAARLHERLQSFTP